MIFEKQIVNAYRGMAYTRCDDNGTAFYFSAEDFEGLSREPFSFVSARGDLLKGYLYAYDAPTEAFLQARKASLAFLENSLEKAKEMLAL